jgi:glyoxylase I family protein
MPKEPAMPTLTFSHIAFSCGDPLAVERFYTKHFGFRRGRVYAPGPDQVVMIKAGNVYLEIFRATKPLPFPRVRGAGPEYPEFRHIAFLVDDLDAKLTEMGADANITLGPLDMSEFIPGMRVVWLADPAGNIVELNQGYVDEPNPPALPAG